MSERDIALIDELYSEPSEQPPTKNHVFEYIEIYYNAATA